MKSGEYEDVRQSKSAPSFDANAFAIAEMPELLQPFLI